ncbi:MAG: RraA family protein [Chloroflexota bacterium]
MSLWKDDAELFEIARRELFTAVVGDIMDQIGLQNQFVPPQVRPLNAEMVVIGRAMTVLEADVYSGEGYANETLSKPFGLMLEALDDLKLNEVYVATGASPSYALWGELMSVRARHLGAVGAVMNGYSRDTRAIVSMGFPVFSYGPYAQDQAPRGKVLDFRVPIKMGGVQINPGDIVFGDIDGVCVVPRAAAEDVFTKALVQPRGEKEVRTAIENGMSAADAFRTYGIL